MLGDLKHAFSYCWNENKHACMLADSRSLPWRKPQNIFRFRKRAGIIILGTICLYSIHAWATYHRDNAILLSMHVLQYTISDVSSCLFGGVSLNCIFVDKAVSDITGSMYINVFGLWTDIFQMHLHACVCKNKEAQKMCFMIWYIPFFPSSLPCSCISTFDGSCWIRPRSLKD